MASSRWATVTGVSPLRIKLDGDTTAIPTTPDSLINPATLAVDDRVRTELSGNRLVVLGRAGGVTTATDAEAILGDEDAKAVTSAALAAVLADAGVRADLGIPYGFAAGIVTITGDGTIHKSAVVTLPSGRFSQAPIVVVGSDNATSGALQVSAITARSTSSFTVRIVSTGNWSGTYSFHWQAVQMTSASASG